jgi:hypothetical protein
MTGYAPSPAILPSGKELSALTGYELWRTPVQVETLRRRYKYLVPAGNLTVII